MGISRVSKINFNNLTSSRLFSVILSHVKSYLKGKRKICCILSRWLIQTRCLVYLPLLVVSRCDSVVVATVWWFGSNVMKYIYGIEYFCFCIILSLHTSPITWRRRHPVPKYWSLLPNALPSLEGVWLGTRLWTAYMITKHAHHIQIHIVFARMYY